MVYGNGKYAVFVQCKAAVTAGGHRTAGDVQGCGKQVFNVIDSRYRRGKPLIVTTNLTLDDLRNPEDTAHSRIYDRLISMCVPVRFTGDNFRQEAAQRKMESMKKLITD